jgi:hypothetical protein
MNPYEIGEVSKLVMAERWQQAEQDRLVAEVRREQRARRYALWRQRVAAWLERLPGRGRARPPLPQSEPR